MRTPLTDKTIRALLNRVAAVQTNRRGSGNDDMHERLLGVAMALRAVRGEQSYIMHWIESAEAEVREHHAQIYPNGCGCGVCRVPEVKR